MEHEESKRKLEGPLAILARYKYVLLIAVVGALLILWPGTQQRAAETAETAAAGEVTDAEAMEQDMEAILSKIRGVGRVDVMLTMQSGSELVLASDTTLRYSGSTHAPDDYDRTSETVTVSGEGGGQDVVVTQQRYPQYRGALIVCEGGGSDAVRLQVVEAVSALTGLGSDRIAVVPWQGSAAAEQEG